MLAFLKTSSVYLSLGVAIFSVINALPSDKPNRVSIDVLCPTVQGVDKKNAFSKVLPEYQICTGLGANNQTYLTRQIDQIG